MKILITGANGQLGYHLQQAFAEHQLYLGDTENYDITKPDQVNRETEQFQPDLIIHGAAYTNVDGAETNQELCRAINVQGTYNVALAAKAVGAKMVTISTDYVFAGDQTEPYRETDHPHPLSYYGLTKLQSEQITQEVNPQSFICRTAWLYGGPKPTATSDLANNRIKNFVYTMLRVGKGRDTIEVVGDQFGGPTYAGDLAEAIKAIATTDQYGIYHTTNSGSTSWANFAQTIFNLAGYPTKVIAISSTIWEQRNPNSTKRPKYSVLGHYALEQAGLPDLRDWKEAISDFLSEFRPK